jgi:hypothetical protein
MVHGTPQSGGNLHRKRRTTTETPFPRVRIHAFHLTVIQNLFSYPLSTAILIAPLSILRRMQNARSKFISSEEYLDVAAFFAPSGVANVLLFPLNRRNCGSKMDSTTLPSSALASSILIPLTPKPVQPTESVEMVNVIAGVQVEQGRDGDDQPG